MNGPAAPRTGIDETALQAASETLSSLPVDASILLVCHVNPDGDAIGSMLGFGLGLRALGFAPVATFPAPFELAPPFDELPGQDLLVPAAQAPVNPDVLVTFDAASAARLGELADRLNTASTSIVIDHHASNGGFGAINLIDPTAAASALVTAALLDHLGVKLEATIAECLYVALATDTGSFKFDLTTAAVHELAARLLATGIRPAEISRRIFDSRPFGAMKLFGEVLSRATLEPAAAGGLGLVWSYATLEDLARHGQRGYVLESLIDAVRVAQEADVACVLKQVSGQEWSVSLRSKGAVDVAQVAVGLGGGGHRLAAGFTGGGSHDEVIASVRAALQPS